MSRLCLCHRRCRHRVAGLGKSALVDPTKLAQLEDVIGILADAADAFDLDGLVIDPRCEVHGPTAEAHGICSCDGPRHSAVEFIQTLQIDVRNAASRPRGAPAHDAGAYRGRRLPMSTPA